MKIRYETEIRVVPVVFATYVTDDFGNEVQLPTCGEIGFRARPIQRANEFIEAGEVH
ncbi:hypothetical protein [Paraburkholderia sp. 22B1P]|uniref:hypothetical protein n=1 Tax=Paraburkholderia sp. 22B1P TaxID=3080498 RepID=UPI003086C88B|nr:hypothetical protein PBP221_17410 [Paraburkholderia sp. 22B1P]